MNKIKDFLIVIIGIMAGVLIMSLMGFFSIISIVLNFILMPFIAIFQLLFIVPFVYFKIKKPLEEDLREIDINSLEVKVRREIEKKIFIYELRGFEPLSILESQIEDNDRGYIQVMINKELGVSLALFYGVFTDKYARYKEIDIEYITFEFENLDKELIQITNHKGNKLPSPNGINQYFIDFEDDVSFQELILDISKKGMIDKNSKYLTRVQNNVLKTTQEDTITQRDYLLELGYFIKNRDYLTLSIKASFASIFKEMYPLNELFNVIEHRKSKKYFDSKEIFLDNYDETIEEEYYKNINNLKSLREYFKTNKKYIEISKKHQIEKIKFTFYGDYDDFIESQLDIIRIDIKLTAQKKLSNHRCLYSNYQININNEDEQSFIYYDEIDIDLDKCEKIDFITQIDKCVEIKKIQNVIRNRYKEAIIAEISLEILDNRLSYIAVIYKLEIDEEPVEIYLDAITAKFFLEKAHKDY